MQLTPTASVYFDKRYVNKKGLSHVTIMVCFKVKGKWSQKAYGTGIWLTAANYNKIAENKVRGELRSIANEINAKLAKATDILKLIPGITKETFTSLFTGDFITYASVEKLYQKKINDLHANGQFGSKNNYACSLSSIKKYAGDGLLLNNIDVDWLKGYELWMAKQGNGKTVLGIYLRSLRAVYNMGIDMKLISRDEYPFRKYKMPSRTVSKVAFDEADQKKAFGEMDLSEADRKALSIWMFSYYCVGMNMVDIASLRPSNVSQTSISYLRHKTGAEIVVPLHPVAKEILSVYGIHSPYLFGVITDNMDEERKYRKIVNWRKRVMIRVKAVFKAAGIDKRVIAYTARHTSANNLLVFGVDIKTLSKLLGHTKLSTTDVYVDGLPFNKQHDLIKSAL